MKILNLDGLRHYTEQMINKVTEMIRANENSKKAICRSSGTENIGKYTKFATIDVSEGAWKGCEGTFDVFDAENRDLKGQLYFHFRSNDTIDVVTTNLFWTNLNYLHVKNSIVAAKVKDGVYDLYYQVPINYSTLNMTLINCAYRERVTLYSAQDYVESVDNIICTSDYKLVGDLKGNADSANTINGLTTTIDELNYVHGVTSNIQTQLNGKADKSTTLAGYGITDANTKAEINEKIELTKNKILDPDNYGEESVQEGGVIVVDLRKGYISSSTGEEEEGEDYLITSFIPVENDKFSLYSDAPVDSTIRIYVYDDEQKWISTANDNSGYYRISNGAKADITGKAKYIRCRLSSSADSGTLTATFDDTVIVDHEIHQKIYFNNGYNMESTLIEDDLYQLQVNATEKEFNIFTIAAPKDNACEATLALMLNDEERTQFVDLSCMKYDEDSRGTFSTILQSRGDTPLPKYILGFNDGKGAGRVRKLEIAPDAIPMQFTSSGIRVRKDNTYDNNWTDDNNVTINLAELSEKIPNWDAAEENAKAYTDTQLESKSDTNHTHNYAGAKSVGGAAINSYKLDGYYSDSYVFNYGNYGTVYFNSSDLNTWTRAGNYSIQSGCTNVPTERGEDVWGTLFVVKGLEDRISQYAIFWNENENPLWHRCLNGSTWSEWKRVRDNGNADKLDGYHASDLVLLSNFIAGNLGSKTAYYSTSVGKDCNSIEDFVALAGGADGLNYPTANAYYYILTLKYSDTAKKQMAFGYKGSVVDDVVFRTYNDGTWTNWKKLYTNSNITYGTNSLTAGNSTLATGSIYLQYE